VAIIPARFASSRLPGKALVDIAGKPMVCWVAERARATKNVDRVIIATDDDRIREVAIAAGFETAMTAPDHLSGTDRIAEVAAKLDSAEVIVNIQGDEPMISPTTIERAVKQMLDEISANTSIGIVTTCEPISSLSELLNFSVVKVVTSDDDIAFYFSRSPIPFPRDATLRHGELGLALETEPGLFTHFRKHTGLYVYRREVLLRFSKWRPTKLEQFERLEQLRALEHGVKIRVIPASSVSIGVDTPEDLEQVREMIALENSVGQPI
jgi:3-deoxy-manno-octulosonate cytidylyltransferase (CMP-KDO synthetase)